MIHQIRIIDAAVCEDHDLYVASTSPRVVPDFHACASTKPGCDVETANPVAVCTELDPESKSLEAKFCRQEFHIMSWTVPGPLLPELFREDLCKQGFPIISNLKPKPANIYDINQILVASRW